MNDQVHCVQKVNAGPNNKGSYRNMRIYSIKPAISQHYERNKNVICILWIVFKDKKKYLYPEVCRRGKP